jgi:hypothetical protein
MLLLSGNMSVVGEMSCLDGQVQRQCVLPTMCCRSSLDDIPDLLGSVAELAAGNASAEAEIRDADGVVLEAIREVVFALGHGANEHTDALAFVQAFDIVFDSHHRGLVAERDFAAVWRQMIGDGVLDDSEELFLRGRAADGQTVQQLDHEAREPFKGTRDPHRRRDFDQYTLGG